MKLNEVYDEMLDIAKRIGVTVRKENGKFKGGNCIINNEEIILINNSIPLETRTSILAGCLTNYRINNVFMKPAVRDYIEKEQFKLEKGEDDDFQLVIEN